MVIGLALSGGGFRATLYHLGVVRYLRDANLLDSVSHITSVSGGSVLAAHLALNWDHYRGDSDDFEAASQEILDFVRLDVRNRILRRYPFAAGSDLLRRFTPGKRRVKDDQSTKDPVTIVEPTRLSVVRRGTILNWAVVHPDAGKTYSFRWKQNR